MHIVMRHRHNNEKQTRLISIQTYIATIILNEIMIKGTFNINVN